VTYLASQEEKSELLKTFQALDANKDGKLTREEIVNGRLCLEINVLDYK